MQEASAVLIFQSFSNFIGKKKKKHGMMNFLSAAVSSKPQVG